MTRELESDVEGASLRGAEIPPASRDTVIKAFKDTVVKLEDAHSNQRFENKRTKHHPDLTGYLYS